MASVNGATGLETSPHATLGETRYENAARASPRRRSPWLRAAPRCPGTSHESSGYSRLVVRSRRIAATADRDRGGRRPHAPRGRNPLPVLVTGRPRRPRGPPFLSAPC